MKLKIYFPTETSPQETKGKWAFQDKAFIEKVEIRCENQHLKYQSYSSDTCKKKAENQQYPE